MSERDDAATKATLPFDPETMDIVCCKIFGGGEFNIDQRVVHRSPTGMGWNYSGSGPSDYALNILNLFVPPGSDGRPPVKCYSGECSATAWDLHWEFKDQFVATLPEEGGTIPGKVIRDWIDQRIEIEEE